jgi:Fe-S-cluster containining protein
MKIITDVDRIRQLSEQNDDENWEFRSSLKMVDLDMDEVDAIVHRHYRDVASQIDCCACANCCRTIAPILSEADIARMAPELNMTEGELIRDYLKPAEQEDGFTFSTIPCPFLADKRCTIYDARPEDCRSYPHIQKDEFLTRLIGVVENCSVCPIVFNVYERLKAESWSGADDFGNLWLDDDYA